MSTDGFRAFPAPAPACDSARRLTGAFLENELSRGEVVLFLDSDDTLFPGAVAHASALVNRLVPEGASTATQTGKAIAQRPPAWLTALSDQAAAQNNELG